MKTQEIIELINVYEDKYTEISEMLKIKNVTFVNGKGEKIKIKNIVDQIIKDFQAIKRIIYENSKQY